VPPRSTAELEEQWTTLNLAPLASVALPGAYAPASIALGVIRTCKPPHPQLLFRQVGSPWEGSYTSAAYNDH
jgi:hypothetical protein